MLLHANFSVLLIKGQLPPKLFLGAMKSSLEQQCASRKNTDRAEEAPWIFPQIQNAPGRVRAPVPVSLQRRWGWISEVVLAAEVALMDSQPYHSSCLVWRSGTHCSGTTVSPATSCLCSPR